MVIFGLIPLPVAIPIFLAFFLLFYADGTMWYPCTFFYNCLGITIAWGITAVWGGTSVFVGADVGGIGQSALALNKFMEADSVLGQVVPSLNEALGMSSSGGGLEL